MKKPNVQMNVVLSTLYQILSMITPLITAPYTARVLGAEGVGINSYTSSVQAYFLLFAALGTYTYGTREIACNRDDRKRRTQLFWEIELLTVITTAVCLLGWGLVVAFGGENRIFYGILSINLLATMFEISWFFGGMERFDYTVSINTLLKVLTIACIFLFVKTPDHLPRFMLIFAAGTLLGNLSMWLFLPQYVDKPDWKNLRIWRHFKNTLIYFVPTIATSVYTVMDKTLIGLITRSNEQNGYYEQATKIINLAKSVAFVAINSVLTSRMSYLYAEQKTEEIKKQKTYSMEYITFMCVGLTFGIWAVAPQFVEAFFGPEYAQVVPLLRIFSPIILIIGISNCIASHYFVPMGLQKQNATFLIIGATVNLILNMILIPTTGGWGAAAASVAAELVITVLYLVYGKAFITLGQTWGFLWKKLLAAAAMVATICLMDGLFTRPVIATACEVAAGVAVYCAVLLILRDRSLTIVLDSVKRKLKK